jgi:hypothetical protein
MFGTILLSRNIFVGLRSKWTMKVLQRWCKASQIPWLFNSTSSMQIHASFIWAWRLHLGRHWKHNNHQIWQIFCCAFIFASVSTLFFHFHQFRHFVELLMEVRAGQLHCSCQRLNPKWIELKERALRNNQGNLWGFTLSSRDSYSSLRSKTCKYTARWQHGAKNCRFWSLKILWWKAKPGPLLLQNR